VDVRGARACVIIVINKQVSNNSIRPVPRDTFLPSFLPCTKHFHKNAFFHPGLEQSPIHSLIHSLKNFNAWFDLLWKYKNEILIVRGFVVIPFCPLRAEVRMVDLLSLFYTF
jgi:hypothetical protein